MEAITSTAPEAEFKPSNLFEYILTYHRGWFATIFLLPVSVTYNTLLRIRRRLSFWMHSAPARHAERVEHVQDQLRSWIAEGSPGKLTTGRSGWFTMSDSVPKYKKTHRRIYVKLQDILEIDETKGTVRVEPLVTMGQITALLNPKGWTLPVLPELDDLTVGGLIMGFGVESSSHKYGLFQYICESFELVTADGSVVHCSRTENPELFYSVPWSHGTLGFLTAAELRIIPARKYVRLHYQPVYSMEELCTRFEAESRNKGRNDFVEALVYGPGRAVIMTGQLTDHLHDDGKKNAIGRYYKPWFYKHVETFMESGLSAVEYIPLRHYYHRHTRSLFWEMAEIIPFGNHPLFRALLGWALPPGISLMKYTETATTRRLREQYHVVQDMLMPVSLLKESLEHFHENYNLYPLWLSPMAIYDNESGTGFLHPFTRSDGQKDTLFVDIGAYGTPKVKGFNGDRALRELENFVIANKGYQALYARSLMSREQFRQMFDHSTYDHLRNLLPLCKNAFDEVYDKVSHKARVSAVEYRSGKKAEEVQV
ncbi:MAG: FAD-binding oxidoreductase [Flavobacteriales bacterium]